MTALGALRPFIRPRVAALPRCELCGSVIESDHIHVVDVAQRSLRCACRACGLLFMHPGAGRGQYRTAPDRWLHDPAFRLTDVQWASLQIPVRMAFFFQHSEMKRWVAFYPGPAGAAESQLSIEAWADITRETRLPLVAEPDIEAILVLGKRTGGYDCFLVPIHACYELVGRVKLKWKGFDGGAEAWQEIDEFFARVRERSEPLGAVA